MTENINLPTELGILIFLILPALIIGSLLLSSNIVVQLTLALNLIAISTFYGAGMQSKKSVEGDSE